MAPNGHTAPQRRKDHPSNKSPCQSWMKTVGHTEFEEWRSDHPKQQLTYDEWKNSAYVAGLSLFLAAADIFNESDSSDGEEVEPVEAKSHPRAARTPLAREPKKQVTTNGNGLARATSPAAPSAQANSGDPSPSGKRKRKTKKVFLSEEIISSGDETAAEQEPLIDATRNGTPIVPAISVNGKRKTPGRKPKKKMLSEEIISPEDELDDPMALDELVVPPVASPLPVRSAPKAKTKAKVPVQPIEPPKRTHILKLSTRRIPKSDSTNNAEQGKLLETPIVPKGVSSADGISAPVERAGLVKLKANLIATPDAARSKIDPGSHAQNETPSQVEEEAASPNTADLSASATRRGLRIRRPAQQRPYYHDAKLFDEVEPIDSNPEEPSTASPEIRSRRASAISFVGRPYDTELFAHLDDDALAILQDSGDDEAAGRRPKTFKGKGRAWKKEESDEDEEFIVAKKKAAKVAKIKVKALPTPNVPKKRGRPRKSVPTSDVVSPGTGTGSANGSPKLAAKDTPKKAKTRKPSRKSVLSAEIVQDSDPDDSDGDGEGDGNLSLTTISIPDEPTISTPKSIKDGGLPGLYTIEQQQPQLQSSLENQRQADNGLENTQYIPARLTPEGTPPLTFPRSYTPKDTPNMEPLALTDVRAGTTAEPHSTATVTTDAAPTDAAPTDAAPTDAAPTITAPANVSPTEATPTVAK